MRLHQLGRILAMVRGLQQLARDFVCCREFRLLQVNDVKAQRRRKECFGLACLLTDRP